MKLIGTKECLQELGKVDEQYLASKLLEARAGQPGHISVELPARGKMYRFTSKLLGSSVVYVERVEKEKEQEDANFQS